MNMSKKKKVFAALAAFSVLTGSAYAADTIVDITINQPYERTGLELGTDSYARGEGSIATGKNSVAIGKGATATGSNETAETIQAKLEENRLKLQEIEDKQKSVKQLGDDLNALKIREQKTIEAGIRVEQIRKAKANAKNVWNNAETAWQDKVDGTADAIAEHNRKLADLNSRLTGVSQLTHNDISTPEGLTAAAKELKAKAEQGTTMNLSVDFYKDYVTSYYKALGDLRLNNKVISDRGNRRIIGQIQENPLHRDLDGIVLQYDSDSISSDHLCTSFAKKSASSARKSDGYERYSSSSYSSDPDFSDVYDNSSTYTSLGEYSIDENGIGRINGLRNRTEQAYNGKIYQTRWNIKSDIVDQATYDKWNAAKEGWRAQIHDANRNSGDEVFGKFDTLTGGKSTTLFNMVTDMKFELVDLDYQICYYQGQYEATQDKTWLDKKKAALDQRQQKLNTNEQTIKDKYQELFGENLPDTKYLFNTIGQNIAKQWKQENIVDIEEKNKITTDKLTGELERELGINKAAIQQYEKEIQDLRDKADQARRNFEGLNPSEEDLLLAREYERVAQELQDKADALKKAADELQDLKDNLKLNDLKDKGADAIAYGTNALVTGNAAIGIGKDVLVTGADSIALGRQNTVSGTQSAAIGTNNTVTGNQTFVLGSGVTTAAKNAVILGAGSTGEDNTVSVGAAGKERRIINVAKGGVSKTSTDAINGSQLYELAQNPATADGMNKENWQQFLGDGTNASGDKGLVTGDTLHQAIESIDVTDQISGKADVNAGNIDGENKTAWQEKLGDGEVTEGDKGLVNGNTVYNAVKDKADTNLNNITEDGKTVIKNIAQDSVKVIDGTNTTVTETTDKDGNKNYAVNVEANGKVEAGNTGIVSGDTVNTAINTVKQDLNADLNKKADANAENITGTNKTAWQEKLGDGEVTEGDKGLVNGGTVYNAVKDKADTNLNNITEDGKTVIKDIAKGSVKVIDGENTTVKATTDNDGNMNYAVNVAATGKAAAGNTGLINGDTLYQAIQDVDVSEAVKNKANTNLNNITVEGKTVIKNIAQDSVKVIDGTNTTVTATTDKDGNKNYAVNVAANGKVEAGNTGIVNGGTVYESVKNKADKKDLLNLATVTQQQLVDLDGRMRNGLAAADNKINQTGALAAALAGMKPLDYDGTERTQISAAVGQYHNKHAVALGAYHYFNRDLLLSGGLAWQGSDVMANVGVTLRVGKRDEGAISRNADVKELADEVIELRKQNKDINAQLEDLIEQIKVLKGSKEKARA